MAVSWRCRAEVEPAAFTRALYRRAGPGRLASSTGEGVKRCNLPNRSPIGSAEAFPVDPGRGKWPDRADERDRRRSPSEDDGQGRVTVGQAEGGVDPKIGTVAAGKYKILRLLGQGGMGSVYEAQNVAIGKKVALKFVLVDKNADPASLARFHREAQAISAVESAHIVQIFDSGQTESGEPFLVMQLLHGETLGSFMKREGKLSSQLAAGIHREITFEMEIAGAGTAGGTPAFDCLLRACAFAASTPSGSPGEK